MQKTIWFQSDKFKLHGTLHFPDETKRPVVIGSHGLLSNGDSPKQIALAEKCNQAGIAFFRFDHRGCGRSGGEFGSATTFEGRCRDLLAGAQTLLKSGETQERLALFGSSFGGAAVLAVAGQLNAAAAVTVAAPVRSREIRAPYINDPSNQPVLESLTRENLDFDIADRLAGITNLMIFHGDADLIVPYKSALEIHERAGVPKELVRLENGDHPMSNPFHQSLFMTRTIDWYRSRLFKND